MQPEQAYAEVERLTRARAKNFAYGIMVLPKPKRRAIAAIYAFARQVDDIADGELPLDEKRARLERLRGLEGDGSQRSSTAACRTSSRRGTRRSTTCAVTARRSPARSASRASPSTGRRTRSAP